VISAERKAYLRRYRQENKDRIAAYKRKWDDAHLKGRPPRKTKEQKRAYHAAWRKTPAGRKSINASRAKWKKTPNGRRYHAEEVRLRQYDRKYAEILLGDPCSYCGGLTEAIDHIEPVARDGDNGWTNLTAACRGCNSRKGTKSLLHANVL
jgi:5-methylcytosine-specific restriction endonuclease McrA